MTTYDHQAASRCGVNAPASITITPVQVAGLLAEDERMTVYVHVIDHPDARVLVDTGMTELHPAVARYVPSLPERAGFRTSPASTSSSTRTCTSTIAAATTCSQANRSTSSAGSSTTRVARRTTRSVSGPMRLAWGTCRSTASSSCCPGSGSSRRPGPRPGSQVVVVETGDHPVVVVGDVAVWSRRARRSRAPKARAWCARSTPSWVWLAHQHEPWRPRARLTWALNDSEPG